MYWACILEVYLNSQKFFSLYCDNATLYVGQSNNVNNVSDYSNSLTSPDPTSVKLVCINVCGLTSKLQFPDFIDFINKYDIVCKTETKRDKCDIIEIPNFDVFC